MWVLAAVECWKAFKPRKYRFDPDPLAISAPEWLALSPGAFHVHRLTSLRDSIVENRATINARGDALRGALKCALVEVGFLLAALLWPIES